MSPRVFLLELSLEFRYSHGDEVVVDLVDQFVVRRLGVWKRARGVKASLAAASVIGHVIFEFP